jgi:hypothetical protein
MRDLALLEVDSGKENYMTKKEVFAAFRKRCSQLSGLLPLNLSFLLRIN